MPRAPRYRHHRQAEQFVSLALMNPFNREVLERAPSLLLGEWWLSSGALFQSVWNVLSGRPVTTGILDYDLIYYHPDSSWQAEDHVIGHARELFADMPIKVQVRNQARVHMWYEAKFGYRYPPLRAAHHALRRFPCRSAAVALTMCGGKVRFVAPFGLEETLGMVVAPNRRLPIQSVYEDKAARWRSEWPDLRVYPW